MSEAIIAPGQNILDLLVRDQGSIENLFEVVWDNGISPTEECEVGTVLEIEELDNEVTRYFDLKGADPATNAPTGVASGGINYMGVEVDFLVS